MSYRLNDNCLIDFLRRGLPNPLTSKKLNLCIANLTGLRKAQVKPLIIIAVLSVRYILSPLIGIGIVKAAANLGFLPADPLYHFVLMLQYTVPPAMNIGKLKMSLLLLNSTQNELIKLMFYGFV